MPIEPGAARRRAARPVSAGSGCARSALPAQVRIGSGSVGRPGSPQRVSLDHRCREAGTWLSRQISGQRHRLTRLDEGETSSLPALRPVDESSRPPSLIATTKDGKGSLIETATSMSGNHENLKGRKPEKRGEGCRFTRHRLPSLSGFRFLSGFRDSFPRLDDSPCKKPLTRSVRGGLTSCGVTVKPGSLGNAGLTAAKA